MEKSVSLLILLSCRLDTLFPSLGLRNAPTSIPHPTRGEGKAGSEHLPFSWTLIACWALFWSPGFTNKRNKNLLFCTSIQASLVAQMVKHLPTMWEAWVQSLGQEDLLEKEMATHSSIPAWEISRTEEPGRLQSMGSQESDLTEHAHFFFWVAVKKYWTLPSSQSLLCSPRNS